MCKEKYTVGPGIGKTQDILPCVGIRNIPDSLLDGLQNGIVFFDTGGVVWRTNGIARRELEAVGDMEGRKLSDILSVNVRKRNILPDMLARFDHPDTDSVAVPQDALLDTGAAGRKFFISGLISRLECGNFMFSFRNVVDEMTNESMVRLALSTTRIFPWFFDFELGVMVIDPRYYEYTRIPTDDYTMSLEEYSSRLHPDDRDAVFNALNMQLNGEHYPYPVPFRLRLGDDTYEWFEGQSTYLGEIGGKPYRIVGICMSSQAHKDIEKALTEAKNRAEQSDMLKSAFLANMSHEIRTPLNAIVGFSNLLTGGDIDHNSEEAREYAGLIDKNCGDLLMLVSDILDLSRIETGAMEYNLSEKSLGSLLREIHDKYRDTIPGGVEFRLDLPAGDMQITTDFTRLRQVVEHLIANAVKFTAKGHIDLGYTMSSDGESVRIFVADTGRGIASDQVEKIFERFYKVDSFMQGAGLGLSICRTIAERLGGKITLSSRIGEGSRFTVKLPIKYKNCNECE